VKRQSQFWNTWEFDFLTDIPGRRPYAEGIFSRIHYPSCFRNKRSQAFQRDDHTYFLRFSGVQQRSSHKSFEFLYRLFYTTFRGGHVYLYHFPARSFSDIGNLTGYYYVFAFPVSQGIRIPEIRIRKSVSKGIGDVFVVFVKIPVSHVDPFVVSSEIYIGPARFRFCLFFSYERQPVHWDFFQGKILMGKVVLQAYRDGHR